LEYSPSEGIDLHIHSTASDGTLSPAEILNRARDLNLKAVAITDHDTVDGSRTALRLGIPPSIQFLTGVEISATPPRGFTVFGSFHILGYGIRLDHPILNDTLEKQQEARRNRNPEILKKLEALGIDIDMEELLAKFPDGQLGRPHIAQLMVRKRYVQSIDEAFDEYIGKGKPAYVEKSSLDASTAFEMIQLAGGCSILAHPSILKIKRRDIFEKLIISLKETGLKGLEVYYPEHTREDIKFFIDISKRHGLLMSGGTDFHGAVNPNIEMGTGNGDFYVPYELYENLLKNCQSTIQSAALPTG
jgi:3',5'-nucleoside bisphosphate phosphatase